MSAWPDRRTRRWTCSRRGTSSTRAPARSSAATVGSADDEWERGKGWALAQAIGCLAYYRETNPTMSRTAHRTLTALLADETDHDGESSRP